MTKPLPQERDPTEEDAAFQLLKHACEQLMKSERFDSIQITASLEHTGGVSYTSYGIGNVFTRLGVMEQVKYNILK